MFDLIFRFLYIGLFTVGGGLAAIPLMLETIVGAGLLEESLFYSMVAISESTPGPIGINLATYIGFERYGVMGAVLTSLAIAAPCFLISFAVSKVFQKFSQAQPVKTAFVGIRACVAGLIATAAWGVLRLNVFDVDALMAHNLAAFIDLRALLLFAALLVCYERFQKHPAVYIAAGAVVGVLFL